jgi:hypothetical protein
LNRYSGDGGGALVSIGPVAVHIAIPAYDGFVKQNLVRAQCIWKGEFSRAAYTPVIQLEPVLLYGPTIRF